MSTFDQIAAERRRAADLLDGLTPRQLDTPSLCGSWTVRQVGAHLLMAISTPLPKFVLAMVAARGSFDRANDALSRRLAERPFTEITTQLRARAGSRFTPPGFGPEAPLADQLIHGQDIRRPLGLTRDFDPESLSATLTFLATARAERAFVPRGLLRGLRLEVPELDWSSGVGPVVSGTGEAMLLAMSGRKISLDELTGDGAPMLRAR